MKKLLLILIMSMICIGMLGCQKHEANNYPIEQEADQGKADDQAQAAETDVQNSDQQSQPAEEKNNEPAVDIAAIKANENGKIMILMYHGIGAEEAEWVRTPDNFRKDLQTLYDKGYRIISLKDYIENNIKVEAGYTPVVLTFDDGLLNQFNYIEENGEQKIDPNCAVGILEDFYKQHPDFGRGASFYVYYPLPFRQKELIKQKFDFLQANGYEIGSHSYNHENLGKISTDEIQEALAKNAINTQKYIEGFEVFSLALPYGGSPKDENEYKYVVQGEYEGVKYHHRAVLKVGSNPAPAPNNVSFDSAKLPRVRASEMKTAGVGLYDWLEHFEKKPNERYISDGNPDTISIPAAEEEKLNKGSIENKQINIY